MLQFVRHNAKHSAGWLLARSVPRLRYANCLFILAHMRCGSTALANVICSRPDVSGYGETHVPHDGPAAPGRLAINHLRHGCHRRTAPLVFDKILHSRLDERAPAQFYQARAIFLLREPAPAVRSIVHLFTRLGKDEYRTDAEAALYYLDRLRMLERHWLRFEPARRVGLTSEALLADPAGQLRRISEGLEFDPPLENSYSSAPASRRGGGGDPLVSGRHRRIEGGLAGTGAGAEPLAISDALSRRLEDQHARLRSLFMASA